MSNKNYHLSQTEQRAGATHINPSPLPAFTFAPKGRLLSAATLFIIWNDRAPRPPIMQFIKFINPNPIAAHSGRQSQPQMRFAQIPHFFGAAMISVIHIVDVAMSRLCRRRRHDDYDKNDKERANLTHKSVVNAQPRRKVSNPSNPHRQIFLRC